MTNNLITMIPGPVAVPEFIRHELSRDHGFGKHEEEFLPLYIETSKLLAKCMGTKHDVVIMSGEGMLALWAGLKSCLKPKDRVLAISTGIFGEGIGQMAAGLGCEVRTLSYPFNSTINNLEEIETAIAEFKPHMITAVHCETPSGTLNPLDGLGALKNKYNVPLFYVDAVSSLAGAPVCMDSWHIDLLLGGSQKCLSTPPSLCFLGISPKAWDIITEVNYQGYDALKPWKNMEKQTICPYTHNWDAVAALKLSIEHILNEGLENVFARHEAVAQLCRKTLTKLGCKPWVADGAIASPTVTTAHIPHGFTWNSWQKALRQNGLVVGNNFGQMAEKTFRMGHMGSQANLKNATQALEIIEKIIEK